MSTTAQILTKIEDILKNCYVEALDNQIGIEPDPLLELIEKKPCAADKIVTAAPIGLNGGFGFGAEGQGTPSSGPQAYQDFTLRTKDMYANIEISHKTILLGSSSAAAILDAVEREVEGSKDAMNWNIARSLYGNGTGILANVKANTTASTEISVDSTKFLREGLMIDFHSTAGGVVQPERRIMFVDHEGGKIIVSGDAFAAVAGFITIQKSFGRELTGLGCIFDDTVPTLYGVTKGDNRWIKPLIKTAYTGLESDPDEFSDDLFYDAVKFARTQRNNDVDVFMVGDDAFKAYRTYAKENGIVIVSDLKFVGGASGFEILCGDRKVKVVQNDFVPGKEAWGINTKDFTFYKTAMDFASYNTSSIFTLINGTSIYRALLACYGDLFCRKPGGCVRIVLDDETTVRP